MKNTWSRIGTFAAVTAVICLTVGAAVASRSFEDRTDFYGMYGLGLGPDFEKLPYMDIRRVRMDWTNKIFSILAFDKREPGEDFDFNNQVRFDIEAHMISFKDQPMCVLSLSTQMGGDSWSLNAENQYRSRGVYRYNYGTDPYKDFDQNGVK